MILFHVKPLWHNNFREIGMPSSGPLDGRSRPAAGRALEVTMGFQRLQGDGGHGPEAARRVLPANARRWCTVHKPAAAEPPDCRYRPARVRAVLEIDIAVTVVAARSSRARGVL
ncbi:hypothetical protein NWFMUON74_32050 [Nocardia wallacei]|uniref:Uncharacterized protein n=1 Tax=Nocardia wallacei TaxID=480035 RepID=A0A7G1KMI5_9NOCA|nr:hypothetical protein NWFMUON74_32050 [Nocardia wallacei]